MSAITFGMSTLEHMEDEPIHAGPFSAWLDEIAGALRGERDSDVPCGTCTACCTSSQFVHIGPDETDALAHIPKALRFPAPGLPKGHVLLGYDEHGQCPMLNDAGCSIYEHRPRTCRTYDCRVFPATGIEPDADKPLIAARARRWRFDFETDDDRSQQDALRAGAPELAERERPPTATRHAVLTLEAFLAR